MNNLKLPPARMVMHYEGKESTSVNFVIVLDDTQFLGGYRYGRDDEYIKDLPHTWTFDIKQALVYKTRNDAEYIAECMWKSKRILSGKPTFKLIDGILLPRLAVKLAKIFWVMKDRNYVPEIDSV